MRYRYGYSVLSLIPAVLFLGCAKEEVTPPVPTPKHAVKQADTLESAIEKRDLVLADKRYLAYRGAHPESSKLPTYMLQLSKAHMEIGEYLLARYYAESYIREYPTGRRIDQAWFLRIKSLFLRYKENDSSQALADQLRAESRDFLSRFGKSPYRKEIKTMLAESQKIIRARNEEIAKAYERMGKTKAAEYYRNKNKTKSSD